MKVLSLNRITLKNGSRQGNALLELEAKTAVTKVNHQILLPKKSSNNMSWTKLSKNKTKLSSKFSSSLILMVQGPST